MNNFVHKHSFESPWSLENIVFHVVRTPEDCHYPALGELAGGSGRQEEHQGKAGGYSSVAGHWPSSLKVLRCIPSTKNQNQPQGPSPV